MQILLSLMQSGSHTSIMSENFVSLVPKHFSTTWFDKQIFLQPVLVAAIFNVFSESLLWKGDSLLE